MKAFDIALYTAAIIIIAYNYSYIQSDKHNAYCESLYMTNQVDMMHQEACDIASTAESINKTKRGQ